MNFVNVSYFVHFSKVIMIIIRKSSPQYENRIMARVHVIPLFHTGPESPELTRIDKYLDSWMNRTQFVMVLTDSHSR